MADSRIRAVITAEDQASAVVKKFGNNVESVGDSVRTLANRAALAGAAITAAFTASLTIGIKSAASYEQNRVAFEGMLGSAEKAKKLLKEIAVAGRETPFELKDLVEGGKRLLAYGVEADKLVSTLKMLGDITALVGVEKMPQLILAYGQVRAATKLTGAELRQFTESAVPLLELLAKQTGKSVAQVKEDIEDGAVSFAMVQKALQSMTEKGGIAFQAMARQSKTFNGIVSNIKDTATLFLNSIMGIDVEGNIREGSIFALAHKAAERLYAFMDANSARVQDHILALQDRLMGFAKTAWPTVKKALDEFVATLRDWVIPFVKDATQWIKNLHDKYPLLTEIIGVVALIAAAFAINPFVTFAALAIGALVLLHNKWDEVSAFFLSKFQEVNAFIQGNDVLRAFFHDFRLELMNLHRQFRDLYRNIEETLRLMGTDSQQVIKAFGFIFLVTIGSAVLGVRTLVQAFTLLLGVINTVLSIMNRIYETTSGVAHAIGRLRDQLKAPTGNYGKAALDILGQNLGFRAEGGAVMSGKPYVVGERGAELFVPSTSGTIIPNGAGASSTMNVSVNVGVYAGTETEKRRIAEELMMALKDVAGAKNMSVTQLIGG